jgi:threonine synthase
MYELFGNDFDSLSRDVISYYFNDEETRSVMREVYRTGKYVMDPHGAIGYLGLKKYLTSAKNATGIFLETAHPAKFREVVEETINTEIKLPPRLKEFMSGTKKSIKISTQFPDFKSLLPTLVS